MAVTALIAMPVTNRKEAEAFIARLNDLGMAYHFDDGAVDCLYGNGHVTLDEAHQIEVKISECYDAWRASGANLRFDCPIGYLLTCEGVSA